MGHVCVISLLKYSSNQNSISKVRNIFLVINTGLADPPPRGVVLFKYSNSLFVIVGWLLGWS